MMMIIHLCVDRENLGSIYRRFNWIRNGWECALYPTYTKGEKGLVDSSTTCENTGCLMLFFYVLIYGLGIRYWNAAGKESGYREYRTWLQFTLVLLNYDMQYNEVRMTRKKRYDHEIAFIAYRAHSRRFIIGRASNLLNKVIKMSKWFVTGGILFSLWHYCWSNSEFCRLLKTWQLTKPNLNISPFQLLTVVNFSPEILASFIMGKKKGLKTGKSHGLSFSVFVA